MGSLVLSIESSTGRTLALLLCCFLISCAPSALLPPSPGEVQAPLGARWERLLSGNQVTGVSAMADIELMSAGRRERLRVALQLQLPSLMRIEAIPVFGPPNFFLSLNREKLKIFLPGDKKFYLGRPSRENLMHFLPISLSPTDMVSILLGIPPAPERGEKIFYRESREGNKWRLDRFSDGRRMQTLWADGAGERLTDMEIVDRETDLTHRVTYGSYLRLGEKDLPQQVTIVSQYGDNRITVHYEEMELSAPEDENTFDLPIPQGVAPTSLDRDEGPWH